MPGVCCARHKTCQLVRWRRRSDDEEGNLAIATVLFLAVVGLLGWQNIPQQDDARISATESSGISLVRPTFAQTGSFFDQEAGMAAYMKVQNPLDLQAAKRAFKIIEQETSDFVVGTVEISNAPLASHAFVSSDG